MFQWEADRANPKAAEAKRLLASNSKSGLITFNPNEHVSCEFDHFKGDGMTDATIRALKEKMGFTALLPCQAQAFRSLAKHRDAILHSRTGSGKTLAYALPVIEKWKSNLIATARQQREDGVKEVMHFEEGCKPFMLIFVFSLELAVQTRDVLRKIYEEDETDDAGNRIYFKQDGSRQPRILVAGYDTVERSEQCDILIGTVSSLDHIIRRQEKNPEDDEKEQEGVGKKRGRAPVKAKEPPTKKRPTEKAVKKKQAEESEGDLSEDDVDAPDEEEEPGTSSGIVDLTGLSTIVIDEVDVTLGPKFSAVGRRMKNLLKAIRRFSSGKQEASMSAEAVHNHQHILCGATIPPWVTKAGFLGQRKYYFQLVGAGTAKIPKELKCFRVEAPVAKRSIKVVEVVADLFKNKRAKRLVVFATNRHIEEVRTGLSAAKVKGMNVRTLLTSQDEEQRIRTVTEFSQGVANVLLCTDIAARGLDFPDVDTVVMTSLGSAANATSLHQAVETFVHRAGRSARAGHAGECVALIDGANESNLVDTIESMLHVRFSPLTTDSTKAVKFQLKVNKTGSVAPGSTPVNLKPKLGSLVVAPSTGKAQTAVDVCRKLLAEGDYKMVDEKDPYAVVFEVSEEKIPVVKGALWKHNLTQLASN